MADNHVLDIIINAKDYATKVLKEFAKNVDSISQKTREAGSAMVAIGAAPTLALVGATKAAIDFESSFAGVKKTVDLTNEEFNDLSNRFRDISKRTPLAINDLNKIGEIAGSLGVSGVDNITKFTETIAKIGITTNLTEEAAAMAFGRIVNIMQEPIENVDRMGATVVDLGNKFASTEQDITEFSERIAGAGKIAGLTTADVFAIGTALSSVGIEAEAGGTAVQKILISMYQAASGSTSSIIDNSKAIASNNKKLEDLKNRLEVATKRQSEFGDKTKESTKMANADAIARYNREIAETSSKLGALNATHGKAAISANGFARVLGVTNKQFNEMFKKDPSAVFEKFVNKLGEISAKGGDAAGVLDDLELSDQRLIRSMLSLSEAGDLINKTFDVAEESWNSNTALTAEAEKRYATTAAQLQIFKNNLYDLGITLGSVILPALNSMLEKLMPLIEGVAKFAEEHPKLTVAVLAAGAAVGLLGGALVIIAGVLPGLVTIFSAVATVVGVVAGAISLPLTLAVVVITALVVALGAAWKNNWGGIQEKTKAVIDWFVNTAVPWIKQHFFDLLTGALDFFTGGWISRFKLMIEVVEKLGFSLQGVIDKARELSGKAIGGFKLPGFKNGGVVPGDINDAQLTVLHGQERVIPRNGTDVHAGLSSGSSININISGSFNIDSDDRVEQLAQRIISMLSRQNEIAGKGLAV
jgi:hypothetical protein